MRRRGGHSAAINLFSFQDIMASVIGMVFIVVLIMALDIVRAKATGAELITDTISEADLQALRTRTGALQEEIRSVEAEIKHLTDRLSLASGDEQAALDEAKQLEATLKSLYDRIQTDQESIAKADTERQRSTQACQAKLKDAEQLRRRASETKASAQTAQATPRLAFIIDPHPDHLEPWLLEISASRIRVASKDGTSAMLEFGGESSEQRKARLLSWLPSQNNQTHYFVLLIKPSGVRLADELETSLKREGFEIGKDLLPEEWEPF